ncbi:MAG: hypothetical protein AB7O52_17965 [Planctomycetota bacterium]
MFGLSYPVDVYYPHSLYDNYKCLPVEYAGTTYVVSIDNYRNLKHGLVEALKLKDALNSVSGGAARKACGGDVSWMNVFSGKGSPEQIGTALRYVPLYREAILRKYPQYECSKLLGKCSPEQPQAMLQAVCDKYIGLDCNGFVGNFVHGVDPKLAPAAGNTGIGTYWSKRTTVRKTLDDICTLDIVIWRDYHIAIVDNYQWVGDQWRFSIAQSTGGGPQVYLHKLTAKGGGKFTFHTVHKGQVGGDCEVISIGLS